MHELQSQLYFPPSFPASKFYLQSGHSGNEWQALPLNQQNDSVEPHWLHLSVGRQPFIYLLILKNKISHFHFKAVKIN